MKCPKCGANWKQYKAGFNPSGSQRYRCGECNRVYTPKPTQHGYSVAYPAGWTAEAATEPWTENTFPLSFTVPQVDFLYDPTLTSDLFLAIASQPIGESTPQDWLAEKMATEEGCGDATEPTTVDGATGLIGCTMAVITADGRGYWIQLYTGDGAPTDYDLVWLEEVLATVQLHPEDAVD